MGLWAAGGNRPRIDPQAYVHPDAVLIGRVDVGSGCYIGPGAVLRGDWVTIRVGPGANVQDNCVLHGEVGGEVVLEQDAHLGHGCIIHSAHIGRNALVGMGAVVADGAHLGEDCVVGAGAVVPAGFRVPAGCLAVGVPARVLGEVRSELARQKRMGTEWYQELARACHDGLLPVTLEECLGALPDEKWRPWIEQTRPIRPAAGETP